MIAGRQRKCRAAIVPLVKLAQGLAPDGRPRIGALCKIASSAKPLRDAGFASLTNPLLAAGKLGKLAGVRKRPGLFREGKKH